VNYQLHTEAAFEHEEQVAYYAARAPGLGHRYHSAFRSAIRQVCETPKRFKVFSAPKIRRAAIDGFPYSIIFRETKDHIHILAIAHNRRRPSYWAQRL